MYRYVYAYIFYMYIYIYIYGNNHRMAVWPIGLAGRPEKASGGDGNSATATGTAASQAGSAWRSSELNPTNLLLHFYEEWLKSQPAVSPESVASLLNPLKSR